MKLLLIYSNIFERQKIKSYNTVLCHSHITLNHFSEERIKDLNKLICQYSEMVKFTNDQSCR